ncbi:MAG: hypothetical protein AB7O26_02225 [Planctomycetaceae bacterium]
MPRHRAAETIPPSCPPTTIAGERHLSANTHAPFSPCDYCLTTSADLPDDRLSAAVYERVCRVNFDAPGFCLIDLGSASTSVALRSFMVALKRNLSAIHLQGASRELSYLSLGRFDQQVTTKLHRDGGPDECFLMLGYEPSEVASEVAISDYARCAHDLGLTPDRLLEQHNPMFGRGEEMLRPYTTCVECFSNQSHQILLVNNSSAPYTSNGSAWQGTLHAAKILNPDDSRRRVVNSTMIASVAAGTPESVPLEEQADFVTTNIVRRRGYQTEHLADDK